MLDMMCISKPKKNINLLSKGKMIHCLSVCYLCSVRWRRIAAPSTSRSARPSASSRTPTTTTTSPPKGKGSRSRSKSPFRSFRWKKSSKSQLPTGGGSASDDETGYDDEEGCIYDQSSKKQFFDPPRFLIITLENAHREPSILSEEIKRFRDFAF